MSNVHDLLDKLWNCYEGMNAQVPRIHNALTELGETNIVNDHIAFRTFAGFKLDLEGLKQPFEALGWQVAGSYDFKQKKLSALHLEHNLDSTLPKIFLSELRVTEFSPEIQGLIKQELEGLSDEFLSGCPLIKGRWQSNKPDLIKYEKLLSESEYAAWLYIFGICPNHFTVSVNHLQHLTSLEQLNDFLLSQGFVLNTTGGLVKGTDADGLKQSSTMAAEVDVEFSCGHVKKIPCCYYEFAQRFELSGQLFQGFVTGSADKIFQSTDSSSQ